MTQIHATTTPLPLFASSSSSSFKKTSFAYLHPFVYQEESTYPFKAQLTTSQKISMSDYQEDPLRSSDYKSIYYRRHYEPHTTSKRHHLPDLMPTSRCDQNTRTISPSLSHHSHEGSDISCDCSRNSSHDFDSPTGSTGSDQFGANKFSLAFILSSSESEEAESEFKSNYPQTLVSKRKRPGSASSMYSSASSSTTSCSSSDSFSPKIAGRKRVRTSGPGIEGAQKKKGSKFCIVEGCMSRAKHARRCWKHGGSVKCKVPSCINRAKSKGVCWSHGGGTTCSYEGCDTISVSNGFCWAHGGGKRCVMDNCNKPAYERTQNLCASHFKSSQQKKK
jgi:hypothetical protein